MSNLTLYIYILLGLLIAYLELRRRFAKQALDALTAFNCYYFVLFVFAPINVIYLGADVVRQKYAYERFGYGNEFTALAVLFSYVLFCLGYWVKSTKSRNPAAGNCYSLRISGRVANIIFLLGLLTTVIYVVQIGGILDVISKANEVRSGELVIESKYIGYRHFSQFSADAFVLFFAVIVGKKARKANITTWDKMFFLCTFVFFVYWALSTGGRREIIFPIILSYIVYSSVEGHVKKVAVSLFLLIFVIAGLGTMLGELDPVNNVPAIVEMARDNDGNALFTIAYDNTTQGLADSFIHYVGAEKASLWQFGFLTDIKNLPRDFFPAQLFGFERDPQMSQEVTEFFTGHALQDGRSGEEPLGLHGYLLVNFGYVGMFALFFLLGLFYKWIHIRFKPAEPKDAVGWLVYWWMVAEFSEYFREGVLILVLKGGLSTWVTIALLMHLQAKQRASLRSSAAVVRIGSISTV